MSSAAANKSVLDRSEVFPVNISSNILHSNTQELVLNRRWYEARMNQTALLATKDLRYTNRSFRQFHQAQAPTSYRIIKTTASRKLKHRVEDKEGLECTYFCAIACRSRSAAVCGFTPLYAAMATFPSNFRLFSATRSCKDHLARVFCVFGSSASLE